VLDLHNKMRSKAIRVLLPRSVRRVVWHKRDFRDTLPVKLALRPYRASMHFADRYHAAVEELVGGDLPRGRLRYFLGPDDRRLADEALAGAGVDLAQPILGLSPGANWETKRWPAERFGDLAALARRQGLQVVVQGSADERELGRCIAERAPGVVDLCGVLDLRALGGFISRCTAFVANDSGPMHVARGLGVPTLAIFGSTDPAMFEFPGHRALFAGIECAPCSFFGRSRCPRGHFRCMLDLDVATAWRALEPLLTAGRSALVSA
jgi:heptosyltransferase-2